MYLPAWFTEIARLPKSLLFLPSQICCADKLAKLVRSEITQDSSLIVALG